MQGWICTDPEVKDIGGKTVIRFQLSVSAKFKKDGDKKWKSFFSIDYWPVDKVPGNVQKEVAKLHKGLEVTFEAEAIQERWEKEGQKHSAVKFVVDGWVRILAPDTNEPPAQSDPDDSPFK
jgi:single-stranded DNA-binding protein